MVSKGVLANWQSIQPAAAIPKALGVVPSTGIVRTRKLGTICNHDKHKAGASTDMLQAVERKSGVYTQNPGNGVRGAE